MTVIDLQNRGYGKCTGIHTLTMCDYYNRQPNLYVGVYGTEHFGGLKTSVFSPIFSAVISCSGSEMSDNTLK